MFERRYFDRKEWEPVDEATVRRTLNGNYRDVDVAIADLQRGIVLRTTGAEYRYRQEQSHDHLRNDA